MLREFGCGLAAFALLAFGGLPGCAVKQAAKKDEAKAVVNFANSVAGSDGTPDGIAKQQNEEESIVRQGDSPQDDPVIIR